MEQIILELFTLRKEFQHVLEYGFVVQGLPESIEQIDRRLHAFFSITFRLRVQR